MVKPSFRHRNAPLEPGAAAAGPAQWLVRCSRERTLIARRQADGDIVLVKIYETGTLEEAAREVALAPAGIDGVARYRGAGIDPATARPSVTLDYCQGVSLEEWIARHGPLAPLAAADVARRLAAILERVHGAASAPAPAGVVHCDVKPGNVLCAGEIPDPQRGALVLLDFEHACPRALVAESAASRGFTGGTHGYAPPEAYRGAQPTPAFDVFGLGATLQALATGSESFPGHDPDAIARAVRRAERCRRHERMLPAALRALIEDCLREDPAHRPTIADVGARLREFLADDSGAERTLDLALRAAWSGDPDEAERLRAQAGAADSARRAALGELIERRRRLLARARPLREADAWEPSLQARADGLAALAARTDAWLERFPCHALALRVRLSVMSETDRMLREVPPTVNQHKRAAQFDAAQRLIAAALRAATTVASFPGRRPHVDASDGGMPGPLQRDPVRFLHAALDDVQRAARVHAELREKLQAAEAALDTEAAWQILDTAAGLYSGANDVVTGLKDRLHRFGFYLERIAQAEPQLARLREQADSIGVEIDLRAIAELAQRCRTRAGAASESGEPGSLRLLAHTLHDVIDEFPHARPAMADAVACLEAASATFTNCCWSMLADAQRRLAAEPVPIRPLQALLNRIDRLRMLEVVVDQQHRTRADLIDELERTRLKVERARATRDRLARGAQAAMDRGHLTTALYEMERAVDQFEGSGEAEPERQHLVEQLRLVRERKDALQASAATERTLAQRYEALRDDPESSFAQRMQILEQRARTLSFLIGNLQEDRAAPYRDDLRELWVAILQERAERAERRLDETDDAAQRLRIARETVAELQREIETGGPDQAAIGRVQRILAHWQSQVARASQALRTDAGGGEKLRRRGLLPVLVIGALLVVGFVLGRCAT